jgi:hypothetical protein
MRAIIEEKENRLRHRLGIPDDAERVLVFAESSHWDPNWMLTSTEYFDRYVRNNLDIALRELLSEHRRVYSVECMFFLRMYWERCPEKRSVLRQLVNEGRLRISNSGVTTADTILPETEVILRGFLLGQEWLRTNGMTQEPKLAYFTDSFGCSPALPSLLTAAGFVYTTITRIDGMRFHSIDFGPPKRPADSVSSADRLLKEERSLDFRWQDRSQAEILCHWNAYTYGQGDLLTYRGLIRLYDFPLAFPDRSEANVARRIRKYVRQLAPYSLTPYMFCPIGFDFVTPIPDLVSILDRHNRCRFPTTGIWVLNAGLDDYLGLVDCHREKLPVIQLDPNPYWTGFYSSRPTLKARCYKLVNELLQAELLSLQTDDPTTIKALSEELKKHWWFAATANHHDFITGTSPDRIVESEQVPWLEQAAEKTRSIIEKLNQDLPIRTSPQAGDNNLSWKERGDRIEIHITDYLLELSQRSGGTIVRANHCTDNRIILQEPSNDLVAYRDSGGLWRMGLEFKGGVWKEEGHCSSHPVHFQIKGQKSGLEIAWSSEIQGHTMDCKIYFSKDSPLIGFQITGLAAKNQTIITRFITALSTSNIVMDTPGGVTLRPLQKTYVPTFWPLHHFIHLRDDREGWGLAIFQPLPGAISFDPDGTLELVALRNATRERAFRFLPMPGNPAKGMEKEKYDFVYYLLFTPSGDWQENRLPEIAMQLKPRSADGLHGRETMDLTAPLFQLDRQDVRIMAAKLAYRGKGWIVRLYSLGTPGPLTLTCKNRKVEAAYLCDARERDLGSLTVTEGIVHLTMPGTIATLRLLFSSTSTSGNYSLEQEDL